MKCEGVMMKNGMMTSDSLYAAEKWLSKLSENERDQPAHSFKNDRHRFIDDYDDIVVVIFFLSQLVLLLLLLYHSYQKSVFKRNISFRLSFGGFLLFSLSQIKCERKKKAKETDGELNWIVFNSQAENGFSFFISLCEYRTASNTMHL